jgi:CO/xanthine dehydrogenase Mo-binding subunit
MGLKQDGTIVALDVKVEIDTGAYFTGAAVVTHNTAISAWGCYRIPSFRVLAESVYTNRVPSTAFRGTGKNQTTFGIECTVDAAARRIGMDPVAFRAKNVLHRGEYIADTWTVNGEDCAADTPPLDTDYLDLMERAVTAIGWDGHVDHGSAGRASGERVARGRGLALSLRHGSQSGGRAYALLALDDAGIVTVHHNAADPGMGSHNMLAVVATHSLGIPLRQVRVRPADSGNRLPFTGVASQRTSVQMGNAVRDAAAGLQREMIACAVQVLGGTPAEWRLEGGRVCRGAEGYDYADVIRRFPQREAMSICALGSYSYPPSADKAFRGLDSWGPGCAAAEVEVDLETGQVKIVRYAAIGDAGKVLHGASAIGQIEGGAIMGMGIALHEDLVYQDGQLMNADPFQYRLPLIDDVPADFHTDLVENLDGPGPFGAKGIGQTSLPCVAPAVGNAIRDAIGVHIHTTPFTPEKLIRALGLLS